MFVLCDKCKNHYDDTCQSIRCEIPYESYSDSLVYPIGPHQQLTSSPIADHVANTREAWVRGRVRRVPVAAQNRPVGATLPMFDPTGHPWP